MPAMGIRSIFARPLAALIARETADWSIRAGEVQKKILFKNIRAAQNTRFGKEHGFADIKTEEDYHRHVPVRDYEDLKPWIEAITAGEHNVLWPGKPAYLAKTSGTTSGTKYIPITKDSLPNHINSARNALLNYVHETGRSTFLDGNLIFLSGSPSLDSVSGIPTGRLSGIVNHHVPP